MQVQVLSISPGTGAGPGAGRGAVPGQGPGADPGQGGQVSQISEPCPTSPEPSGPKLGPRAERPCLPGLDYQPLEGVVIRRGNDRELHSGKPGPTGPSGPRAHSHKCQP
eukprot:834772-Karenia_brevis.AAC.1